MAQTTVEFAFVCIPFFALLFAIVDYAQIYFYENSLQNALREASRFASSGRIIQLTYADGSPVYETNAGVVLPKAIPSQYGAYEASRQECIKAWFVSNCVIKHIYATQITLVSAPTLPGKDPVTTNDAKGRLYLVGGFDTNADGTPGTNPVPAVPGPGNANDYVQISAQYKIPTLTPLASWLGGYGDRANGFNTYPIYFSVIVKNEPALLNFQHIAVNPGDQ